MEPFLDGGLFELLIAIFFALSLNFIFLKKYLLLIFSGLILSFPILLFFISKNELYYWIVSLCSLNAVFLVVLLWKEKNKNPDQPLFDVDIMKNKLSAIRNKLKTILSRITKPIFPKPDRKIELKK
jgi:hypothetical protein